MQAKVPHLDANESMFLLRQLDYIKTQTYDTKYAALKARQLIPVSASNPGADKIFYRSYNQSGMAKLISNFADDIPRADVTGQEFYVTVHTIASSYAYNVIEIRRAFYGNVPLEQRRANAARRAIAQKENTIALLGEPEANIQGFLNNPNTTTVTIPNDGTGSSTLWNTKTPDQILRDMNLVANSIVSTSLGVEIPDTLLLPLNNFNYVASTARSPNSDTTILQYFMSNNPYIKQVEWVNELLTSGPSGVTQMMAYRRDPDALTLEIPSDFEQMELEHKGLNYSIDCIEQIAGVIIYYPLSIASGYNI